jgi:nucleotide-binding universal stress UspA family protein
MKKRSIVLIDFSENSTELIKYVADWAVQTDMEILLLHQTIVVAPALTDVDNKREITQHTNAEARKKLSRLARAHLPDQTKVTYSVSDEPLTRTLERLLEQPFDDLVFVGMKGTSLVKQLVMGSVALDVINNTGNCIVAVPKGLITFTQSTLHVSVTEKYPLNILALNNYLNFLGDREVRIVFFYLAAPNESTAGIERQLRELSDLFAYRLKTDFAIFEGSDTFQDIKKVVIDRADEVLVVQRGSRLLTDQIFRKFLINELVYEGHIPLVVLP